ncbi:hypothetical protein C2E21_7805 [Chlorella sorokiniana]|jgi:hypothetical protein|uniref:Uncharacterized protein n=1 Tax=Chlorella sorokiniana TaxID=3076 RepID=A0A2P6TG86_CHLSO|nr:hypothetical protein C2E21_7805 [Chlorella sorokiniana]|eukprot:PRW33129.1 hypothetical protein C2E21_7805 [Chlorella sorokiniana]
MEKEPADIYHAGDDALEAPTKLESMGHETLQHHKERIMMAGATDAEMLKQEGADLPHDTDAGKVHIHGPADPEV